MLCLALLIPTDKSKEPLGLAVAVTNRLLVTAGHVLTKGGHLAGSELEVILHYSSTRSYRAQPLNRTLELGSEHDIAILKALEDLPVERANLPPSSPSYNGRFAQYEKPALEDQYRTTKPLVRTCRVKSRDWYPTVEGEGLSEGVSGSPILTDDDELAGVLTHAGSHRATVVVPQKLIYDLIARHLCEVLPTQLREVALSLGLKFTSAANWNEVLETFTGSPPSGALLPLVTHAITTSLSLRRDRVIDAAIEWLDFTLEDNKLPAIEVVRFLHEQRDAGGTLRKTDVRSVDQRVLDKLVNHHLLVASQDGCVHAFRSDLLLTWKPAMRGTPIDISDVEGEPSTHEIPVPWIGNAVAFGVESCFRRPDGLSQPRLCVALDRDPNKPPNGEANPYYAYSHYVAVADSTSVRVFDLDDAGRNFVYRAHALVKSFEPSTKGFCIRTVSGAIIYLDPDDSQSRDAPRVTDIDLPGPEALGSAANDLAVGLQGPSHWGSVPRLGRKVTFDDVRGIVSMRDRVEGDRDRSTFAVAGRVGWLSLSIVDGLVAAIVDTADRARSELIYVEGDIVRTTSITNATQVAVGPNRTVLVLTSKSEFRVWQPTAVDPHPNVLCRNTGTITDIAGCADGWLLGVRSEGLLRFARSIDAAANWQAEPCFAVEEFDGTWPRNANDFLIRDGDKFREVTWNRQ